MPETTDNKSKFALDMTLRQMYAKDIACGLIANQTTTPVVTPEMIAKASFKVADAMIAFEDNEHSEKE